MGSRRRRLAVKALQVLVATAALAWLIAQVDGLRTLALLGTIGIEIILVLAIVTGLEFVSRFAMWHVLLNGSRPTRFGSAAKIDVLIKFINHLIPSKASGHSIAPVVLHHYTEHNWPESVATAVVNTGLYATLYGIAAVIGLAVFWTAFPVGLVIVVGGSTALYLVIGGTVLGIGRRMASTGPWLERIAHPVSALPGIGVLLETALGKLETLAQPTGETFTTLSRRMDIVGPYTLAWLGTLMVFPGLRVGAVLWALEAPFQSYLLLPFLLVMAYSVTILPITPGGVGIAETSAVIVFIAVGISEEIAVSVVFIDRLLGVYLPALLGWYPATKIDIGRLLSRAPEAGMNAN